MGGFALNIEDVKNYEELLYPAGKYEVEILSGKDGETKNGRGKIDLRAKVLETIPAGEDIDTEKYLDPIDQNLFITIYLPVEGDVSRTKNMMTKIIQGYLIHFEIEAADPGILTGADFVGTTGGVVLKHEKAFRDDPDSEMRATVKGACAL